jgi:hypothetical protein
MPVTYDITCHGNSFPSQPPVISRIFCGLCTVVEGGLVMRIISNEEAANIDELLHVARTANMRSVAIRSLHGEFRAYFMLTWSEQISI